MSKTKPEEFTISWKEQGAYPIRLVASAFDEADETLAQTLRECGKGAMPRVLLVADYNVVNYTEGLGSRIGRYFQAHNIKLAGSAVILSGGEKIKNESRSGIDRVMSAALEMRVGHNDVILAIGGGCVLDVAGYAAAQLRGGIQLVRMPTTLSSQAGGAYTDYAAINEGYIKDAFRVVSRPAAVIVDVSFTRTILDAVWRGGLSECIRYAAVQDASLFKWMCENKEVLFARDESAADTLVRSLVTSLAKKGRTNFSLWASLRLEAMSGYRLPYGYALAIGVCLDGMYAVSKGLVKEEDWQAVPEFLHQCGALQGLSHSKRLFAQPSNVLMGLDAWELTTGSMARQLPKAIGKSIIEETPDREVYEDVLARFEASIPAF